MEDDGGGRGPNLGPGPCGGGADLISILPEDLLLQVLVRLRCARAAAITGLLSRRWRGLWTRLPGLTFRDVALDPLLHALQAVAVGPGVPLLDICLVSVSPGSQAERARYWERVSSLLHAAAGLSPVELHLAVRSQFSSRFFYVNMNVAQFHRATSMELRGVGLAFPGAPRRSWSRRAASLELDRASTDPRNSFPLLERLTLSSCSVDLTELVLRCPRLRVLREADGTQYMGILIKSASLQELHMECGTPFMQRIHIEAPALKQLALTVGTSCALRARMSILAPLLEKVSWLCRYTAVTVGLGRWGLSVVTLKPAESSAHEDIAASGEDACLQLPPHVHVLSLYSVAHISHSFPEAAAELTEEIEKHMIISFSVLELHFVSRGHVFGAFALHLLAMPRIFTATRSLKIVLWRSEDKEACPVNCPCDEPRNWRSQSISLTNLERVEINGFEGEDHEFDFLELLFRCATMLKRLTVRPSDEATTSNDWCTKTYEIFKAYPSVECNIDLSPGSTQDIHSGAST